MLVKITGMSNRPVYGCFSKGSVHMNPDSNSLLGLPVATLLAHWPQLVPIFWKYHMLCIGCSLAAFDTLAQALDEHHIPAQPFLAECAAALQPSRLQTPVRKETHGL